MSIKTLVCSLSAVLLLSGAAQAQTTPAKGRVQPKPRAATAQPGAAVKDGLTMKGGRVVLTELGITNPITADKTLINGTVISTTGLVTAKDGTTTQMGEGDQVSLTGRVTSRAAIMEADSLLKIKQFDQKYPGKRKKMEEERAKKEKDKKEREEAKAKAAAKREKDKAKSKK
ncbi:hypothetical protein Q5H93_01770 [Hymenobacter sp. ASUV-10]|uniref:DUF6799 domain-containing protein n=1 Tax=Hymenobacter aranciens TaxID=3063996 RepID=A0ABT9B588_9BACT|nr:DUF6799 domain-containing protein [Hymenobacter sp. ASUV-10]MDO7873441.1 hypothetical protein [Hymenobacter sp. ASUV-10]